LKLIPRKLLNLPSCVSSPLCLPLIVYFDRRSHESVGEIHSHMLLLEIIVAINVNLRIHLCSPFANLLFKLKAFHSPFFFLNLKEISSLTIGVSMEYVSFTTYRHFKTQIYTANVSTSYVCVISLAICSRISY